MYISEQTKVIMALLKISGIGPAKVLTIYKKIPSYDVKLIKDFFNIDLTASIFEEVEKDIKYAEENKVKIISIADSDFPKLSNPKIPNGDMPVLLYYIGNIKLLGNTDKNVAIIGTRHPSITGTKACKTLVKKIINKGLVVVSGLANGCDATAHKTAIEYNGKTIAILPTPPHLTKINTSLASEISFKDGLLVSEYLYSDKSKQEYSRNCAKRDKLIVMFSKNIFLIEGNISSGSAISMQIAAKYSINSFAINPTTKESETDFGLNKKLIHTQAVNPIKFVNDTINDSDLSFLSNNSIKSPSLF